MSRFKFPIGLLVKLNPYEHGVIVDHRPGSQRAYLVVRTAPDGSSPMGKPVAMKSTEIEDAGKGSVARPVEIYQSNARRGFVNECQCRKIDIYQEAPMGLQERADQVAERAGWVRTERTPGDWLFKPAMPSASSQDSLKRGLQRAANIEDVAVDINSASAGVIFVSFDPLAD